MLKLFEKVISERLYKLLLAIVIIIGAAISLFICYTLKGDLNNSIVMELECDSSACFVKIENQETEVSFQVYNLYVYAEDKDLNNNLAQNVYYVGEIKSQKACKIESELGKECLPYKKIELKFKDFNSLKGKEIILKCVADLGLTTVENPYCHRDVPK